MDGRDVLAAALRDEAAMARAALAEPALLAGWCDLSYIAQAHHRLISRELARFADTPGARLAIATPPQVGKTRLAIEWFAFWLLARNPDTRIIITSYGDRLARERGEYIRELINTHGWRFGLRIRRGSNTTELFKIDGASGMVRSAGRGAAMTGMPADVVLIDDPLKDWIEGSSAATRHKVWMWLGSVTRTRLSAGGRVMIVATRWHPDDPTGMYLRQSPDRWRTIVLPALATSDHDPLGRAVGDPLPKPGVDEHDRAALLTEWDGARSEVPLQVWTAMYQADPAPPTNHLISADLLEDRITDPAAAAEPRMWCVAIDPSVGERDAADGDGEDTQDVCGILGGYLGVDDRVYVTADRSGVMSVSTWPRRAMSLAHEIGAGLVVYESNQGGHALRLLLSGAWSALLADGTVTGDCPKIVPRPASSGASKVERAHVIAGLIETDRVRCVDRLAAWFAEWVTWTAGDASPARIDATGVMVRELLPDRPRSTVPRSAPASPAMAVSGVSHPYPWRGRLSYGV